MPPLQPVLYCTLEGTITPEMPPPAAVPDAAAAAASSSEDDEDAADSLLQLARVLGDSEKHELPPGASAAENEAFKATLVKARAMLLSAIDKRLRA